MNAPSQAPKRAPENENLWNCLAEKARVNGITWGIYTAAFAVCAVMGYIEYSAGRSADNPDVSTTPSAVSPLTPPTKEYLVVPAMPDNRIATNNPKKDDMPMSAE